MEDVTEVKKFQHPSEQPRDVAYEGGDFDGESYSVDTNSADASGKHGKDSSHERLVRDRLQAAKSAVHPVAKDAILQQVEDILAENLVDEFRQLTESKRRAFKHAGEEAAASIYALVTSGKATLKNILKLIERWLSMIVTKQGYWWAKQEAYIKAKKILLINSAA